MARITAIFLKIQWKAHFGLGASFSGDRFCNCRIGQGGKQQIVTPSTM